MDSDSTKALEKILAKDVSMLTEADKQFLVARRDHLSDEHTDKFRDVIEKTLSRNLAKDGEPETPAKAPRTRKAADSADSANSFFITAKPHTMGRQESLCQKSSKPRQTGRNSSRRLLHNRQHNREHRLSRANSPPLLQQLLRIMNKSSKCPAARTKFSRLSPRSRKSALEH